jgi:hypothetical protein
MTDAVVAAAPSLRGAKRQSNPDRLLGSDWIASLTLAMTLEEVSTA